MIAYAETVGTYLTPNGNPATFIVRDGTSDHNTVYSACNEDEYGFRGLSFAGVAFDIGAHIGAVAVGLAIDNPELTVVAVEPVADNCRLIRANAEANGVGGRVVIMEAAAGAPGMTETRVHFGFRGSEIATHHAFIGATDIGNPRMVDNWRVASDHDIATVDAVSYDQLSRWYGIPSLVKIDCEGAEFAFLSDPAIAAVPLIVGEWHNVPYRDGSASQADLLALLPHHRVTFDHREWDEAGERRNNDAGPQGFRAVL